VSQKERPGRPLYRNAVTVWMLIAQGIDSTMTGLIHAAARRRCARLERDARDDDVQAQVPAERHMSQNIIDQGVGMRSTFSRPTAAHVDDDEEAAHDHRADRQETRPEW